MVLITVELLLRIIGGSMELLRRFSELIGWGCFGGGLSRVGRGILFCGVGFYI